ncbi:MAG: 4Fe-4S binding protein [Methanotrichaceae archaeon]
MVVKNLHMTLKRALHDTEVTRLYPEVIMDLPDAMRGLHNLDVRKCIGCGACARICPNDCIELVPYKYGNPLKNKKMKFPQIDYGRCMFCGLCVDECPTDCLTMSKRFEISGWNREDIIYEPDQIAIGKYTEEEEAKLVEEAKKVAEERKKKAAAAKAKKAKAAKKENEESGKKNTKKKKAE